MARKKIEDAENPNPDATPKPGLKVVDAKHSITYNEPLLVRATEPEPEPEVEDEEDIDEVERREPKVKSLRTRIKEKLSKNGITDTEQLRLRIDRLPMYDANGQAGINAEKEFLRTTTCTESFFTSDEYLDHIRAIGGPGTYWLTLRHKNNIVASWQERIGGAPQTEAPSIEGVPVAMNGGVDPSAMMDAFMRQFEKFQKIQAAMLPPWMKQVNPEWMQTNQPAQANTTESALMTLLNSDDELLNQATGKLRKLLRGDGAAAEDKGPWDAVVALLTSPTLPQTLGMLAQQFRQPPAANPEPQAQPSEAAPPQPPPDQIMYMRLLQILTDTMRLNADPAPVVDALVGFCAFFPQHQISAENLLNSETQQLLAMLPQFYQPAAEVVGLPHTAEWVEKLKLAYFGEDEEPK